MQYIALSDRPFSDTMWNERGSRHFKSWSNLGSFLLTLCLYEVFMIKLKSLILYVERKFLWFLPFCGRFSWIVIELLSSPYVERYILLKLQNYLLRNFQNYKIFAASKSRNNFSTLLKTCEIKRFAVNRSKSLVVNNFREPVLPWTSA